MVSLTSSPGLAQPGLTSPGSAGTPGSPVIFTAGDPHFQWATGTPYLS